MNSEITLKAHWYPLKKVTFDSDGGSAVAAQYVEPDSYATKPSVDPIKTGYRFDGWFLGESETGFDFEHTKITTDITLKAKWFKLLVVNFDSAGGSAIDNQYLEPGQKATAPANPVRTGFQFSYWHVSGQDTAYDFDTPVTGDLTLIAKWIAIHTVSFDSNGGTSVPSQSVLDGNKASKPADPTRNDYVFTGWYLGGNLFDFDTPITSDLSLSAGWVPEHTPGPDPGPTPVPDEKIERDKKVIINEDGSTTIIEWEKITRKDGSTTETTTETTEHDDGRSLVKEDVVDIDKDGNRTSKSKETAIHYDESGNKVKDVTSTDIAADSSSRSLEDHSVTDSDGKVIERNVEIVNRDGEGGERGFRIEGDSEGVRVYMPDTGMDFLLEAEPIITEIDPKKVEIVFDPESGMMIIPAAYLKEASDNDYGISLSNSYEDVRLDKNVIKTLAELGSDAIVSIHVATPEELTEQQRSIIGSNYAISLSINAGSTTVSQLGGIAEISLDTKTHYDHVYYIAEDGTYEDIPCSYHDEAINFSLVHFSIYTMTVGPLEAGDGDDSSWILMAAIGAVAIVALLIAVVLVMRKL